jgi:hypothetical protein
MESPQVQRTTRTIKRIAPLRAGIILAIMYAVLGLVLIPFFLLAMAISSQMPQAQRAGVMAFGAGFAVLIPIFYAVMGFIGGVLGAFVYNLAARWVGGFEVEVE